MLSYRIGLIVVLAAPAAFVMAQDQDEATKAELKKLEGSWKMVSMQMAGVNVPLEGKKFLFIFKGDKVIQSVDGMASPPATVKINAKADPKHLDTILPEGPHMGKADMALYILDGDTLKIGSFKGDTSIGKRPTAFPKDGDKEMDIFVLKREKA